MIFINMAENNDVITFKTETTRKVSSIKECKKPNNYADNFLTRKNIAVKKWYLFPAHFCNHCMESLEVIWYILETNDYTTKRRCLVDSKTYIS